MLLIAENWPFTAAALVMAAIGMIEVIALLIGTSFFGLLQEALPLDLPDTATDIDSAFDKVLGWLHVGRVPFLALLVLFLASFAFIGFVANQISHRWFGMWLPPVLSVPAAFLLALPVVRLLGMWPASIIERDETYAVSFQSLVGRVATIAYGTARRGYPAQARVQNEHGQSIYVMVEPNAEDVTFQRDERVLLSEHVSGSRFVAVVNPWPDLI